MRLCAPCQKRFKAILKAYNVGPSAMRDKRSLAREWALIIKEALNGLCWCSGGDCQGTSLPPRIPSVPTPAADAARRKKQREYRKRLKRQKGALDLRGARWTSTGVFLPTGSRRKKKKSSRGR